ncbi:MAG: hypothetical protein RIB71_12840 [Imperialibacter sp.]|uniref:hypothetical protein n=1 Tax=Imperialibacter sp. TaxID=2038411 RepID=UPI0032EC2A6A
MYEILLFTHSWLRWVTLILFAVVLFNSLGGMNGGKEYLKKDKTLTTSLVGTLHLQLLIGLLLYFVYSPITTTAMENMKIAMKVGAVRYWAVEHISIMIVAVIVAQIGSIRVKKTSVDKKKFKLQTIFFGIALILILSRIPWSESARLFRF